MKENKKRSREEMLYEARHPVIDSPSINVKENSPRAKSSFNKQKTFTITDATYETICIDDTLPF